MTVKEEWKHIDWIPEVNGLYMVSNFGKVKSLARPTHNKYGVPVGIRPERLLTPTHSRKYLAVKLCHYGYAKTVYIHRLVSIAFIDIPQRFMDEGLSFNDLEINHIDGDPENNYIENLEWCTRRENIDHAVRNHLMIKGKKGGESPRAKKVAMYDLNGNLIKIFSSLKDVCEFFKIKSASHISSVCKGNRYSTLCHIFKYVNNDEAVETKISVPKLPRASLDQIKRKEYDTFRSAGHSDKE